MNKSRKAMITIAGGNGFIGQAFQRFFKERGLAFFVLSRKETDYTRPEELEKALKKIRPDFLINAAGFTGRPNVDGCEDHKAECLMANAVLPGIIGKVCQDLGLPWGHVSSGCIYSGRRPDGGGFREEDPPNFCFRQGPCSFYSGSKALGEEVLRDFPNVFIWRVRMPFSHIDGPRNYLGKLLRYDRLLDAENSLSRLEDFVKAAHACWERRLPFGTYHLTNPGSVTTRQITGLIRRHNLSSKEFRFFSGEDEFMTTAVRAPRSNCVLDTSKIERAGLPMPEIHTALESALAQWQPST